MGDETTATDPKTAGEQEPGLQGNETDGDPTLLGEANGEPTLLGEAGGEDQQAELEEEKRLLETEDEDLSEEGKLKKAELIKKKEIDAKNKEVPEKYEFKLPEGMVLDKALADKISPIFKEMKIPQEDAQKLVDIYSEHVKAVSDAQSAAFQQFLQDSYKETVSALGSNYKEQLKYVAKVRDRFLSEETQEMLDASGLSNNKAFILDLIKLGKLISEDKAVSGKKETPVSGKTAAELLYPQQGKT